MAELLLKTTPGSRYSEGDCIAAYNRESIAREHAKIICHPDRSSRNASGMFESGSLWQRFCELVYEYRIDRISPTEAIRTGIRDGSLDRIGPPEADVRLYLRRRKAGQGMIFGEDGAEFWYGGNPRLTRPITAALWQMIEAQTPYRRSDERFSLFVWGRLDIRSHLAIRMEDFSDRDQASFTEPEYETDDNGRFIWERQDADTKEKKAGTETLDQKPDDREDWTLAVSSKRRRRVEWGDILSDIGESRSAVIDPTIPIGIEAADDIIGIRFNSKNQRRQRPDRVAKKTRRPARRQRG